MTVNLLPHQASRLTVIVNADDLGLSAGVNRGILHAHAHGIVTSASLMVRAPHAAAAVRDAAAHPALAIGLHLDMGEWHYTGEAWIAAYEVVPLDDPEAVAREVDAQLARFEAIVGRSPTHLDSHQHVHRGEPLRTIATARAARLGVPLRDVTPGIRYEGGFYGQAAKGEPYPEGIAPATLVALLEALPPGTTTELGCHPGLDDESGSSYSSERAVEVATLCDPAVRAAIERNGIALRSYARNL
jgi:predicted glycoside hydrolase/deacetylase ChbG (UPF0249 family)